MNKPSTKTAVRSERFSNGLVISPSHVSLGVQTWAVGQIKRVGVSPAASGIGMIVCGLLLLLFMSAIFTSDGGAPGLFALFALLCAYGIYSSWVGVNTTQVWLQTGLTPTFIFKSRNTAEAYRVKVCLEQMIAQHTPNA